MDKPHITRHPDGAVSVGVHDSGAHLAITAGPGATPALLRVAYNAMRTELMPGRTEGE